MRSCYRSIRSLSMAVALISPIFVTGCAGHVGYRVYDPGYNDYHAWNNHEVVYYHQWEAETHRPDRDFRKRDQNEQKEYWNWRHHHPDR
ncbi:MAG: hypothetical protein ACREBW_10620 [Candidatus Micrarchaeaceae archaeon]